MKRVHLTLFVCALAVSFDPSTAAPQDRQPPDGLEAISMLLGRWEGASDGQPGVGQVRREYARVLNGRFIRVDNRSTYAPQSKNPKGEVHEDIGIFSFDAARQRIVLRQFHIEGFVNEYVQDAAAQGGRVVLTSESIENIPPGWRARETYVVLGPDEFEEIFELAGPEKPFELYSRARLKRAR